MEIKGFLRESFQDWDEGLCSVVFTGTCNYKCPSCYARKLIYNSQTLDENEVLRKIAARRKYINKIVISGGEPTLQHDLPEFLRKLRKLEIKIKLDTNGSNPFMLGEIIQDKLVDYVAMDIKGPTSLYRKLIGLEKENEFKRFDFRDNIEKAIGIIQRADDFEFRTTIVPVDRTLSVCDRLSNPEKRITWMTNEEFLDMADWIKGHIYIDRKNVKWYLQKFTARSKEEMMSERFAKENLPEEYRETPQKIMEQMLAAGKQSGFDFRLR